VAEVDVAEVAVRSGGGEGAVRPLEIGRARNRARGGLLKKGPLALGSEAQLQFWIRRCLRGSVRCAETTPESMCGFGPIRYPTHTHKHHWGPRGIPMGGGAHPRGLRWRRWGRRAAGAHLRLTYRQGANPSGIGGGVRRVGSGVGWVGDGGRVGLGRPSGVRPQQPIPAAHPRPLRCTQGWGGGASRDGGDRSRGCPCVGLWADRCPPRWPPRGTGARLHCGRRRVTAKPSPPSECPQCQAPPPRTIRGERMQHLARILRHPCHLLKVQPPEARPPEPGRDAGVGRRGRTNAAVAAGGMASSSGSSGAGIHEEGWRGTTPFPQTEVFGPRPAAKSMGRGAQRAPGGGSVSAGGGREATAPCDAIKGSHRGKPTPSPSSLENRGCRAPGPSPFVSDSATPSRFCCSQGLCFEPGKAGGQDPSRQRLPCGPGCPPRGGGWRAPGRWPFAPSGASGRRRRRWSPPPGAGPGGPRRGTPGGRGAARGGAACRR